jgi:hypothetical protein
MTSHTPPYRVHALEGLTPAEQQAAIQEHVDRLAPTLGWTEATRAQYVAESVSTLPDRIEELRAWTAKHRDLYRDLEEPEL